MKFDYSEIAQWWLAYGEDDRVYTIKVLPNGYFTAEGDGMKRCVRTHHEAVQACETWEAQAQDETVVLSEAN